MIKIMMSRFSNIFILILKCSLMRLFPMRSFPVSANGESCLGPVFRPLMDSDQHSFPISLCHIGVPRFS